MALAKLQADTLVTHDEEVTQAASKLVRIASLEELLSPARGGDLAVLEQ